MSTTSSNTPFTNSYPVNADPDSESKCGYDSPASVLEETMIPADEAAHTPDPTSRAFTYFVSGSAAVCYASVARAAVHKFVTYLSASADVLALASLEVDIGAIQEGKLTSFHLALSSYCLSASDLFSNIGFPISIAISFLIIILFPCLCVVVFFSHFLGMCTTVKWRGKPVFIRHRTRKEIETAVADDSQPLRDPETDAERVQKPEWIVVIGVCTHLGCVPINGTGDYHGWFCPCHGSHYDVSGRIRKGPAPLNLVVPEYKFLSDTKVLLG